jgi:S-DNA-T family DNA segregation ATPase FtsK/SpoIIIE
MRCDDCGYEYDTYSRSELAGEIRGFGPAYAAALFGVPDVRARPAPEVWSPLEYACHVRDVFHVQRERVLLALREETPEFEPMRRDERAVEMRYNAQDPAAVVADLDNAADALAALFESLDEPSWQCTGMYSYPEPKKRTVEWIARHTIHEGVHHLGDLSDGAQ